jgi:DNA-binding MarR family transcriptional regulator
MALRGNLRDFTITQLLNLINLANKTGTLVVEGPAETVQVAFREGRLAYAQINQDDNSLASVLYRAKKISQSQFNSIQKHAAHISDKELGLLLINAGFLSQDDILNNLQQHFTDIIQHLFSWVEGLFHFDNDMLPPDNRISVRLDLENLIIEGSRQMREWEQLKDEIPSLDMALKFTDRPGANLKKINLSVEEWRVVSYINPRNTIRQIANTTKMNDLEIRRIVYGLLQAGLVEITRLENATPPTSSIRVFPTEDKEEQKSLVNRLISRIRSL